MKKFINILLTILIVSLIASCDDGTRNVYIQKCTLNGEGKHILETPEVKRLNRDQLSVLTIGDSVKLGIEANTYHILYVEGHQQNQQQNQQNH